MKKKIILTIIFISFLNIISLILYSTGTITLLLAIAIIIISTGHILLILYNFSIIKKLQEQIIKDQFTQIYNKQYFEEILKQKVNYAHRNSSALALIMFDIDDFKYINDMHGHQIGDDILLELVKTIKYSIRSYDIFSRVGGEEFTIIMSDTSYKEVSETAERIRKKIEAINLNGIKITVSIGVSTLEKKDSVSSFKENADKAMYMSKYSGKNTIHYPSNFNILEN